MIVSDSTPLIYLAKLGHLQLLQDLFGEVRVTAEVIEEIAHGKQQGFGDATTIENAASDGWLKVRGLCAARRRRLSKLRHTFPDISEADTSVLVLAKDLRMTLCMDDSRAVKAAEMLKLRHIGTFGIILLSVKSKLMRRDQAEGLILSLQEHGFYIGPDLLSEYSESSETT
jgi:predicted nucleic acid-binding protein